MASLRISVSMSTAGLSMLGCFTILFLSSINGLTFHPSDISRLDEASVDCSAAFYGESLQINEVGASARLGLVHKDGLCSPLRSTPPLVAEFELTEEFITHESNRVRFIQSKLGARIGTSELASASAPLVSGTSIGTGNYLVKVGFGTPARELMLVVDTGSEIAWTQCEPCASTSACYSQADAIFAPQSSSSYKAVPCGGSVCGSLDSASAGGCVSGVCQYQVEYLDGSFTKGDFATETLSIGGTLVPGFEFGCGHDNEGLFKGFDGVMGFDRSAKGFPAQTSGTFGELFAYCLPSSTSSSAGFVELGSAASPSASRTPLSSISNALYVAELTSVDVGSAVLTPSAAVPLIVDSGTVISRLSTTLYNDLRDAFKAGTSGLTLASSSVGEGLFDTCYTATSSSVSIPKISFNLAGGVAFSPPAASLLYPLTGGIYCLAFAPLETTGDVSILGNYQQQHYRFAFDLPGSVLSIDPGAC